MPVRIMHDKIPKNLQLLLAKLKAMESDKITIQYCGEGDSGEIESPEYEPPTLRAHVAAHEVNQLTEFLESLLDISHINLWAMGREAAEWHADGLSVTYESLPETFAQYERMDKQRQKGRGSK